MCVVIFLDTMPGPTEVRDVEATIVKIIDSAEVSACGGWASKGTVDSPHWLIESMDGAGLTHTASGVRVR